MPARTAFDLVRAQTVYQKIQTAFLQHAPAGEWLMEWKSLFKIVSLKATYCPSRDLQQTLQDAKDLLLPQRVLLREDLSYFAAHRLPDAYHERLTLLHAVEEL